MSETNKQVLLAKRPDPETTADCFKMGEAEKPTPGDGQFLVRVIYVSCEPAMRGWIAAGPNYSEPVPVDGAMRSLAIGEVVESKHRNYARGEVLYGWFGWQEWALCDGSEIMLHVDWPRLRRAHVPLGQAGHLLGITGITGYLGLTELGRPHAGDTVAVSTAAGGVGSVVGQVAHLLGCRTVGITGSDEKVRQCREEFGYNVALNYKSECDLSAAIEAACPKGVDVYFDNTAGEISDAVMPHLALKARVIVCGTMAIPSSPPPQGPRYNRWILTKRARMEGFLIFDWLDHAAEAVQTMLPWVAEGRLKGRLDIASSLEEAPAQLVKVLKGENEGKALVRVGPDPE